MTAPFNIVVLAAGRGTRMASTLPKVLHPLAGKPLLAHVLDTARGRISLALAQLDGIRVPGDVLELYVATGDVIAEHVGRAFGRHQDQAPGDRVRLGGADGDHRVVRIDTVDGPRVDHLRELIRESDALVELVEDDHVAPGVQEIDRAGAWRQRFHGRGPQAIRDHDPAKAEVVAQHPVDHGVRKRRQVG